MKKSTFILGVISTFLVLIGGAFKIQHWPGAGICLTLGVVLFAFVYSIMLMIDKNALAQNSFQKFVNVITMVAMMLIPVSFLFKAQHWPGAGIGIFIGNFILLAMIPILFAHGSKESDPVKKLNFNNEAILLVLLTAFSFFIWLVLHSVS
ncbi:MAG: hypothetical protein NT144_12950 [Bacteroidia bacterium]|nr:hypothetical protein [Bacteroidia bacterium]